MRRTLLTLAMTLSACGDDGGLTDAGGGPDGTTTDGPVGGPIDGSWLVESFTCDGTPQMIPRLTVHIARSSGSFVIEIPTVCTSTITESYSYPTATSIAIAPTANDCDPDGAACAPAFGGVDVCPTPPPTTFDFVRAGSSLTFSRTSAGPPVDSCPAGQRVEYEMTLL
jgi:hypothetical protein